MEIQLLPSGTPPDNQDNKPVITCEGVKTCDKVSGQYAIHQKERSTDDSQLARDVERLNCCRLKKVIDKKDNMDCNELIAYWMMEGYLGHVDSVMKAYKKGHEIFMDFKYLRMPRREFYEKEIFDSLASETTYKRYRVDFDTDFSYSTMGLGFIDVFDFHAEAPKFGPLVPDNGVIRTLGNDGCTCLLLDGNQLGREVLRYFTNHLKHFAYFNPRPNLLQRTLRDLKNLSVLVLRGCRFLEEIDSCIGEMAELTVLEISHSSSIRTIPETFFKKVTKLRSLNLSYLAIEKLPKYSFPKLVDLRWIILRGCSRLTELPSTREMTKLEVIDLYDATSLKKLSTTNFRSSPLKMLDLSNTHVTRVPCLWNFQGNGSSNITHLILRNCLSIYVFDIVGKLLSLQVLDVSGSENLKQISIESLEALVILDLSRTGLSELTNNSFKKLGKLKVLNLSRTKISSMPPVSGLSSLLRLIVQGCESLKKLEIEKELSSLQFLDVSGCRKLEGWGAISFGQWSSLVSLNLSDTTIESFTVFNSSGSSSSEQHLELFQILDLSKTSIKELPSLSLIKSLKQLLLAGCSKLSSVPDLEILTELEVLDLSGTDIEKEFLPKAPTSLRKLLLKDCSKIEGSLPLESLSLLQELDLRGSGVSEFPEDIISGRMPHLKCLRLPHKIAITRVDWRRMKDCLPDEIYWDQLNIFESVKVLISSEVEHSMCAKPSDDSHIFRLEDSEDKWEAYFKEFHFSVSPKEEHQDAAEIQFGGSELVFKGHHPLARKVPYMKPNCPSVEIHGFSTFPEDAKSGLEQAVNVALVGNSYITSLSEQCAQSMKAVKVCWINSCTKMEFVLKSCKSEVHEGGKEENGDLGVLETLVLSNLASLKAFCPEKSENVSSRSIISLEHMYVDCCPVLNKIISASHLPENLETLHIKFCDQLVDVCDGNASECKLTKLYELSLLDLPKLEQIGADLPSLKTLRISQCPELKILDSILQCARSTVTHLILDSCPQLEHVLPSSMLPENLLSLEIRACDKLTTVFESAGSSSSTSKPSLPNLRHLQLWNLPNLMSIGGVFPSLETHEIKYCSRFPQADWPKGKTET